MTKRDMTETELDALFDAAHKSVPDPAPDFLARLEQDAARALAPRPAARPLGWFARLRQSIGGWGGLGGLVTATVAGFWIGVSPPASLADSLDVLAMLEGPTESYSDLLGDLSETELFLLEDG